MPDSFECATRRIRLLLGRSQIPEDPRHAEDTLEWLLRLRPDAGRPLRLGALGHDIERAVDGERVERADFEDYDSFKRAHARNSARILRPILIGCGLEPDVVAEVCRLVERHEVGGDPDSDLLKEADSISFFAVNLPYYFRREGWEETKRRVEWGLSRLSPRGREIIEGFSYEDEALNRFLQEVLREREDR